MPDHGDVRSARLLRGGSVAGLLVLAAAFLTPAVQTGYWAEDLYQSLTPRACAVLLGQPLRDTIASHIKHTLLNGRFFPLTPALISTVHYFCRDAWTYKAYIVAAGVLDLYLFTLLIGKLGGRRDFACFAACVTLGLIQFRVAIDPSLGFFGQMQLLIAALFLSMLALQRHLEGQGRRWLAASVALYLACALMYEVSYALVPLHLCLILRAPAGWGRRLRMALPFLGVVVACALQTAFIRWLHPTDAYWNHPSFDPGAVALAVAHQSSAGLPLSYLLADPLGIFPDRAGALARWLLDGRAALLALPAFGLCFLSLRGRDASGEPQPAGIGRWWLAALGLILAVFPAPMIAISPYHRANLSPGVGWIPVLIQDYGVGLLMAGGIWLGVTAKAGGGARAAWKCASAALLVALLVGITDRANREVVRCFNATPGSRLFRIEVARAGGGLHNHRLLLEAALGAGLLDEVPERSTIQAAREYPFWFDATYGRMFLAANAGKAFETASSPVGTVATAPASYRLRDVLVGREAGFVVLSRADGTPPPAGSPAPAGLRLFVRHPGLLPDGAGATFRLSDKRAQAASPAISGRDLPVIRSGRGWALVSLDAAGGSIPPDSLRVEFDPNRSASLAHGRPTEDLRSGLRLRR